MAIFKKLTKEEIAEYSHEGLFCGCVPVYAKDVDSEGPELVEKNWVPCGTLEIVSAVFDFFAFLSGWEGGWPLNLRKNKFYKHESWRHGKEPERRYPKC